jgi:hypothetical protein
VTIPELSPGADVVVVALVPDVVVIGVLVVSLVPDVVVAGELSCA